MKTWKKAKVHLLPAALKSGKAGQLAKVHNGKTLGILVSDYSGGGYWIKHSSSHKDGTFYETGEVYNPMPYHIYITTNEEIKEGDWRIIDNVVTNYSPLKNEEYGRKIIATTDPDLGTLNRVELRKKRQQPQTFTQLPSPSQDWIKEYVKNPVEDIEVEFEIKDGGRVLNDEDEICDDFYLGVVVNPDNTINIRSVKDSFTREEVVTFAKKYGEQIQRFTGVENDGETCYCTLDKDKWINENL